MIWFIEKRSNKRGGEKMKKMLKKNACDKQFFVSAYESEGKTNTASKSCGGKSNGGTECGNKSNNTTQGC